MAKAKIRSNSVVPILIHLPPNYGKIPPVSQFY